MNPSGRPRSPTPAASGSRRCRSAIASTRAIPTRRPTSGWWAIDAGIAVAHDLAVPAVHDHEVGADDVVVVAEQVRARRPVERPSRASRAHGTPASCRGPRGRRPRRAGGAGRARCRRTAAGRSGWPTRSGTAAPRTGRRADAAGAPGGRRSRVTQSSCSPDGRVPVRPRPIHITGARAWSAPARRSRPRRRPRRR